MTLVHAISISSVIQHQPFVPLKDRRSVDAHGGSVHGFSEGDTSYSLAGVHK